MKIARAAVLALLAVFDPKIRIHIRGCVPPNIRNRLRIRGCQKNRIRAIPGQTLQHIIEDCPITRYTGLISAEVQNLDLLRLLMERPLVGGHNRWDRGPSIEDRLDQLWHRKYGEYPPRYNEDLRGSSTKRSAVATALNAGRPRRQPAPLGKVVTPFAGNGLTQSAVTTLNAGRPRRQPAPLGKVVTPFAGIGILNDMDTFFESLRGNLQGMASLSPDERADFYDPPTVVQPPSQGGGGGGGMRKLHALRPLRPTGNIRSYNRRSLVEDHIYPGANRHDPGLLWAGLGR